MSKFLTNLLHHCPNKWQHNGHESSAISCMSIPSNQWISLNQNPPCRNHDDRSCKLVSEQPCSSPVMSSSNDACRMWRGKTRMERDEHLPEALVNFCKGRDSIRTEHPLNKFRGLVPPCTAPGVAKHFRFQQRSDYEQLCGGGWLALKQCFAGYLLIV